MLGSNQAYQRVWARDSMICGLGLWLLCQDAEGRTIHRRSLETLRQFQSERGAWPFIGGFYVAALVNVGRLQVAAYQLKKLVQMNSLGKKEKWESTNGFTANPGVP